MVDSLYNESPVSSQRRLTCHRATGFFYFYSSRLSRRRYSAVHYDQGSGKLEDFSFHFDKSDLRREILDLSF